MGLSQKPSCTLNDRGTRLSWPDRSARTSDESGTYLIFESVDALCNRRRSQVESAGSFGDRTVIDRQHKTFKKSGVHCQPKVNSEETTIYYIFSISNAKRTASAKRSLAGTQRPSHRGDAP